MRKVLQIKLEQKTGMGEALSGGGHWESDNRAKTWTRYLLAGKNASEKWCDFYPFHHNLPVQTIGSRAEIQGRNSVLFQIFQSIHQVQQTKIHNSNIIFLIKQEKTILLPLIRGLDRLKNWNVVKKWTWREFQAGSRTNTYFAFW